MKKVNRREFLLATAAAGVMITGSSVLFDRRGEALAKESASIKLPDYRPGNGNVVLKLLEKRSTSREFSPEPLPVAVLSNLLWAAFGVNRPETGKRTAPSARNNQEIDIYVATANGLYLHDAKVNALKQVSAEDIRGLTGKQAYVKQAAVNLVYVADTSKMGTFSDEDKLFHAATDTGFISQNVYLFCAAEGLATGVRSGIDRLPLAKALGLRPDQRITLAQSVGYPKKG